MITISWSNGQKVRTCDTLGDVTGMTPEEYQAALRAHRDKLIAETDFYALTDRVLAMTLAMKAYRQALRDVPQQNGWPHDIVWPVKPEE